MNSRSAAGNSNRTDTSALKPRPLGLKLLTLILALLAAATLSEGVLRLFFRQNFFDFQDERTLLYRYDKVLGWFPLAGSKDRLLGSRVISVAHNRHGFRAPEWSAFDLRRPGILFLGDSYVWGYDVEADERFTEKLQTRHPEWAVYNLGVSGYGTDQQYLLLQQKLQSFKPRVVFLLFCTETDDHDNSSNLRYGGYYKPYCTVTTNRLQLHGVPVPRGERAWIADHPKLSRSLLMRLLAQAWFKIAAPPVVHNPSPTGPIIRDMQKYVQAQGSLFVMGLTKSNPPLEEFLRFFKIPYIDLSTSLRYPGFGNHWTPEGHSFVCEQIDRFLQEENFMTERRVP